MAAAIIIERMVARVMATSSPQRIRQFVELTIWRYQRLVRVWGVSATIMAPVWYRKKRACTIHLLLWSQWRLFFFQKSYHSMDHVWNGWTCGRSISFIYHVRVVHAHDSDLCRERNLDWLRGYGCHDRFDHLGTCPDYCDVCLRVWCSLLSTVSVVYCKILATFKWLQGSASQCTRLTRIKCMLLL